MRRVLPQHPERRPCLSGLGADRKTPPRKGFLWKARSKSLSLLFLVCVLVKAGGGAVLKRDRFLFLSLPPQGTPSALNAESELRVQGPGSWASWGQDGWAARIVHGNLYFTCASQIGLICQGRYVHIVFPMPNFLEAMLRDVDGGLLLTAGRESGTQWVNPGEHRQPQPRIARVINGSTRGPCWVHAGKEDAMDSPVHVMQCSHKYLHLLINFFFFFSRQLTMTWAHTAKSVIFSAMTLTGKSEPPA